jgi:hypothetical protein
MRISFLSIVDYANVLTEYSYCLNKHSKDIESKSICFQKHPFNYSIQHDYDLETCDKIKIEKSKQFLLESDIIIFSEEGWEGQQPNLVYKTINKFSSLYGFDLFEIKAKFCVWHPGSCYRQVYSFYNNHPQRDKIYKHFYALDLYHLSPKGQKDTPLWPYQYFNFDKNKFISDFKNKIKTPPWTILHIPSNINTKGTREITQTINNLNLNPSQYVFKSMQGVSHDKVIKEKEKSIFYIDQYNPSVGGYGIASLEGLFTSNLTFSTVNNIGLSIQKLTGNNEIGIIPLGENVNDLTNTLNHFFSELTPEDWINYVEVIGGWIEECYSFNNIVKIFKNIIE